jgi:serine/threonine protein kinase/tetratricopeptide (TPR) repeat protein
MNADPNPTKAIFLEAVERHAPDQWPAFLDRACAGQPVLRGQVEALLEAHREVGTAQMQELSEGTGAGRVATVDDPPVCEQPGAVIGPYKLLEHIGEGGFGVVFMAEQTEPVRRKVALKVLKPGMDSRQVVARFEAERQALAIMDHPNIAKVFDGGATPSGRPYFVMELVKGAPITDFCDQNQLTPRERLELFVPVCQAVQHAHQKGIIHRDLKPSNVLVSRHDSTPVVKVIDFGVAKALGQELTDKTLFTGVAQMVGTPLYMSPERAGMSDLDVDTRSDVYSLGVLLYELLTGTTPFTKDRFQRAAYDEIRRIIREEEPPRPSTRFSESKDSLPSISAQRHTEPAKLTKLVRGELDWIVMKALEKDRNRRYETANGFAMDVQRYLADEPVQACPPSAAYRLRKFMRRNKVGLAVAGLVLGFLLALGTGAGWALRDREAREREAAQEAARKLALTEEDIRQALGRAGSSLAELHAALKNKGGVQALLNQPARWELFLRTAQAELTQAQRLLAGAGRELGADVVEALDRLEQQFAGDEADYRLALRLEKIRLDRANRVKVAFDYRVAAEEYPRAFAHLGVLNQNPEAAAALLAASPIKDQLVAALDDWAWVVTYELKRKDLTEQLLAVARRAAPDAAWGDRLRRFEVWGDKEALARVVADAPAAGSSPQLALLVGYLLRSDRPLQVPWLRRAQAEHPSDFWLALELGNVLPDNEQAEAAIWFRLALAIRPTSAAAWTNLGYALNAQGKFPEAIAACRKAIELEANNAVAYAGLGAVFNNQRKFNEAIAACQKAIEIAPKFAVSYSNLGAALHSQGIVAEDPAKLDEAVAAYRKSIELDPNFAPGHRNLGLALFNQKKWADASGAFRKAIELEPNHANAYGYLGAALANQGRLDEAIAAHRRAVELEPKNTPANRNLGLALNTLAWALATDPVPTRRDPGRAVSVANEAVELNPREGATHNTLGVALYRADRWKESVATLEKSMELRKGGDSDDWFFLAMAHWKLGEKDKAREWYDRAVQWMDKHQPKNEELRRFRAEAAELLGLNEKK